MTTAERKQALELLGRLDPPQRAAVLRFMEFLLIDPVARALATAPPDDEPATEDDRRSIQDGQAWLASHDGKGAPIAEVMAEFGAKPEDFSADP